jgi:P4 family phage/plasmid primase-like protien
MAKDTLDIHLEVGAQDFLDIRVAESPAKGFEIDVLGPDKKLLYALRPTDALDKTSLVVLLAQEMSRDPHFGFGRDQLPYRWLDNRWVSVERWLASLDYSMHALVRTAVNRRMSSDSLAFEALSAWQANSAYPQDGLDLCAFGTCPGIPFNDKILKLSKGGWVTVDHLPQHFNTRVLAVEADVAKQMYLDLSMGDRADSALMKFLSTTLDDQQQVVIRRWFGYHLLSSTIPNAEKMLYLWGSGANGKSQLLHLIRGLVGKDACAELRLPDLRTSANIEKLVSKLAMIGSEAKTATDLETLKSLISREPINCNPKYRDPFTVTPECLVSQASNDAPEFGDKSDAMVRRTLSLHLKNSFLDEASRTEDLAARIVEKEYPLLVGLALWGADELSEKGRFFVPAGVAEISKKTVEGGNHIHDFAEMVEFGPYEISIKELFTIYTRWSREQGHHKSMDRKAMLVDIKKLAGDRKCTLKTMIKATNYESQHWIDVRGDRTQIDPTLKPGTRPDILQGLRIGAHVYGVPLGQLIPESREIAHLFPVQVVPATNRVVGQSEESPDVPEAAPA